MDRPARSKLNTQIHEEACEWFVECRGGELDVAARAAFDRWLRKSPEHLGAYLEIAAIWDEGDSLDPQDKWDAETLIADAATDNGNVVSLTSASISGASSTAPVIPDRPPSSATPRSWRPFAIAASIAGLAAAATLAWFQLVRPPHYATATGEQRSIVLADGSTVELNSRSRIEVRYSPHERGIELLDGQALFHVAKDPARPFIVHSDSTQVRAVGTKFDVYRKHGGTIVTVIEGRVAVLSGSIARSVFNAVSEHSSSSAPPGEANAGRQDQSAEKDVRNAFVSAGEQLTVTPQMLTKTDRPNIPGATAWTQRQMVFDSATLAEVAEEFNRYNERQIVIEDPDLYDFHISGVFSSTDAGALVAFLHGRRGVRVIETAAEIRVTKN